MYNKMLSYRVETALQGALVLAKSGRLELGGKLFADIIDLSSTTVPEKLSNSMKKTQNKGYYVVQGHSMSSRSVPIGSPYATSYYSDQ